MQRRHLLFLLFLLPLWLGARAQNQDLPVASPVDAVHLYVIPTDDISEQAAGQIARALTQVSGLWVKSTGWSPSGKLEPFPGTNQYAGEDYFPIGVRASRMLKEVSPRTYFIVLTNRDINSSSRNFRFQYSMHSPMLNTSVLSVARLQHYGDGTPAPLDVVGARVGKMLLRIVGEMRMGWKRTSDPADLMFAPIMSIDDIDRMDLAASVQARKDKALGGTNHAGDGI